MTGLTIKFGKNDNFKKFSVKVMEHLRDTGMDTILYLPDPADKLRMLSVVSHHSHFSFDSVCEDSNLLFPSFNNYYDDAQNVMSAIKFLLDLLSLDLQDIIMLKWSKSNTFIIIWMYLVGVVTSTSVEKWDMLKTKLKAIVPSQYAGEDMNLLVHDYMTHRKTLNAAGSVQPDSHAQHGGWVPPCRWHKPSC